MASINSYLKDEMRNEIESATTATELQPALEHVPLDALKSFLTEQMNQKSDSELRSIHYATLSIDVILSEDVIQNILSFDCFLRHKAVDKQWKFLSEKNETNWMRNRLAISRAIPENDRKLIREPKPAWRLFNESRIAKLKNPSDNVDARTRRSRKIWKKMSDEDKWTWIQKESVERAERQRMKKHCDTHFCDIHVPERWLFHEQAPSISPFVGFCT